MMYILSLILLGVLSPVLQNSAMLEGGSIRGKVYDQTSGATIALAEIHTLPRTGIAVSAPDGSYSLEGLKTGRYVVVAVKAGYAEHRVTVDVQGENTTVDLLLKPTHAPTTTPHGLARYFPRAGAPQDLLSGNPEARLVGVTWTEDRLGVPQGAARFDGEKSYGLLGNIPGEVFSSPVAKFTVMGWARTDDLPSQKGGGSLVAKAAGGTYGPYQWSVCHDEDGLVKGFVASEADASVYLEKKSLYVSCGEWFHFALVFDGSIEPLQRVQLYVDGVPGIFSRSVGSLGTSTKDTPQHITVGATHHAGQPFSAGNFYRGSIGDIRIYDRALSQREIKSIFDSKE